jgi:DoxX-like family
MNANTFAYAMRPKATRFRRRIGVALTSLAVLFLLMDAVMKLLALPAVLSSTAQLGYPASEQFARNLGAVLLLCTVLYAWPRTAVLGAILLTGYLGGAIASHLRIGSPIFTHVLFGAYVALFVWGGLFLRDERVRGLFLQLGGFTRVDH